MRLHFWRLSFVLLGQAIVLAVPTLRVSAMTETEQAKVERVARALADRRGSKVVQRAHRLDAIAAIAAMETDDGSD